MSQQLTVNLPASESDERETSAFFFQYVYRRAVKDQELRASDTDVIGRQKEQAVQAVDDETAVKVASTLADLGDVIDAHYHQEMNELIDLTGDPETAYSTFYCVVENMFTWDESGRAMINFGRIAALMAYCYQLCKTFITKNVTTSGVIANFMGTVFGWLFKFLIKARFYEWLQSHGGWGQLTIIATRSARGIVLVGSVVLLAIVAFSYFRGGR